MGSPSPIDSKKLVEALLGDLRLLSQEAKKKQNHVKEAAESGVARIRNISTASGEKSLLTNLRAACSELLHPLVLACATRQTKLVQIALQGIQRLIQHRVLSTSGAGIVVNELWSLVEDECEELRVLQTVPPLVSSELVVTGNVLAKCIVMCFRLHFAKDPAVINAASAAVRQLVCCVFERVIQEDGIFSSELKVVPPSGGRPSPRAAPPTLRPCAADAYMLFRDLCLLINAEPSIWLVGIHEMTRTLGLELLESLLKSFPSVFIRHAEFGGLLRDDVCPLIIRLFSPNLKSINIASQHPSSKPSTGLTTSERPYFPIAMRLVRIVTILVSFYHQILPTECEIFISTLLKFIEADRRGWQRPLALEALHRIFVRSDLIRWICETFDSRSSSTKVLEQVSTGFAAVVLQSLTATQLSSMDQDSDNDRSQESGGPGFYSKGFWVPYVEQLTAKKSFLIDALDRLEATNLPEGYVISRCCVAICDMTQAVYAAIDELCLPDENLKSTEQNTHIAEVAYKNSQPSLLFTVCQLLSASCDETVTDQLLCCLSTLIAAGCRMKCGLELHRSVYVLASLSLPSPSYLNQFAAVPPPAQESSDYELFTDVSSWSSSTQVMATGPPCPCPVISTELWNRQVILTSKNLQAAKSLLVAIAGHSDALDDLWYLCLTACQHLTWMLAMRPTQVGMFSRESMDDGQASGPITVTTAALAEISVLASMIDKISPAVSALDDPTLLMVFDALIRLSDENLAVAATGRDSSMFPIALVFRCSTLNLNRLNVFWQKTSAHFVKVCNHTSVTMRDWAAIGLTSLVKQAMKTKTQMDPDEQQKLCVSSLLVLCSIPHMQVRRRQLDCIMSLIQSEGALLSPSLWPTIIQIISAIIDNDACELSLVRQGYLGLRLVSSDFLQSLPFSCVTDLVEAVARYGKQTADQNISLSALTLLWTISDFIFRKMDVVGADESEKVWMVLYTCLSESCVDARFAVRKSACQTLLQTITAHGHALRSFAWRDIIWQILIPLLDKVRSHTRCASNERTNVEFIIHHSRDTEQKQWVETCIHTLLAVSKIFNSQRKSLLVLNDFGSVWEALMTYLEWAACYENAELSLSAIKSYQEVLLGRISTQTLSINSNEKNSGSEAILDMVPPELPLKQWVESWQTWLKISKGLARLGSGPSSTQGKSTYIPGPSHLTALLHVFPPLFDKVAKSITVADLKYENLPTVLESMINVPIPSEQVPFVLPSSTSHLTPTQEALLDAVKVIFVECTMSGSTLRAGVADEIRLLLRFAAMATARIAHKREYAMNCIVPFAEYSLRMAVEFFTSTVLYPEVSNSLVVIDVLTFLGEPLYLKYTCISPNTWKLAAISLMSVLKAAIPYARQNAETFVGLWPVVCDTMEKFLFSPNVCNRLAADERKRDELLECQAIEVIRTEILPYASRMPPADVQRMISLLHRGSISQLDPTDVLASDSHAQRTELAKACFDALLNSSGGEEDEKLSNVAVTSLLQRCTQVMSDFIRDSSTCGDLRLPRSRVGEIIAALQAIDSLIARLAREPKGTELYSQLVSLFPSVVDVITSSSTDAVLQAQLVKTLKSFQTLLLLQNIPQYSQL